jgi:hypothetical protein
VLRSVAGDQGGVIWGEVKKALGEGQTDGKDGRAYFRRVKSRAVLVCSSSTIFLVLRSC